MRQLFQRHAVTCTNIRLNIAAELLSVYRLGVSIPIPATCAGLETLPVRAYGLQAGPSYSRRRIRLTVQVRAISIGIPKAEMSRTISWLCAPQIRVGGFNPPRCQDQRADGTDGSPEST